MQDRGANCNAGAQLRSDLMGRTRVSGKPPSLKLEKELWDEGRDMVVGVDEVGRGSWAGPLTVAAAVLPAAPRVKGIRDSKMLTPARREELYDRIRDWCVASGIGHATHAECDELGMSDAQRLAWSRAVDDLGITPDAVLIDGKWDFVGSGRRKTIVKGDRISLSIASASILAKVTRDRMMREDAANYPAYAFDQNKGYPCPKHKTALQGYGPSAIHRRSWVFMERLEWQGALRFVPPDPQGSLFA
jgi:ribonuclease HII